MFQKQEHHASDITGHLMLGKYQPIDWDGGKLQ